jgi:benzoyl-CoA reductase subunit B
MSWVIALQQLLDIPAFIIEVPYVWDLKDEERHRATIMSHLREFVAFLEKVSGRPYNWDALQEKLATLKQAMTLRNQAFRLGCSHIPAPGTFFDWSVCLGPSTYLIARPETVEFYGQLKAEVEERVAQHVSAITNEKYRIMWEGLMFWPKVGELARKFAAADCAVVGGSYTNLTFWPYPEQIDPEHPLETIAQYLLGSGISNRDPAIYQDVIIQMCRDFSVDGVMLSVPHTCRPNSLALKLLGPRLQRELGIPVMEVEADPTDVNFYSESRTNYAVDGLLEAIASGKER